MGTALPADGLMRLQRRILDDAEKEASRIKDAAQAKAEEILKEASAKAEVRYSEIMSAAQKERETRKQRLITLARLDGRRMLLAAKDQALQDVFAEAMNAMVSSYRQRYRDFLRELLAATATYDVQEVIFNERDRSELASGLVSEVQDLLKRQGRNVRIDVSQETRPIRGGFLLRSGNIEINCSVEAIFQNKRDELIPEVAGVLFAE
ncbi:MAG: hypothetical protein HPY52_03750 [Firmicutes bacterium]|nr:hypothetical protein [Bacillota bacterium]